MASKKLHSVYIAIGSNIGNKKNNLLTAIQQINLTIGTVTEISSFLENKAQGFETQNIFLNACIICITNYSPIETLDKLKKIEVNMGRKNSQGFYEDRIIDLDIIFYDQLVYESDVLTIPHKKYKDRDFVLIPLSELSPNEKFQKINI